MTPHAQQKETVDNELDAAKAIVQLLQALDEEKQERAIRFASETLGLHTQAQPAAYTTPKPAGQCHEHGEKAAKSLPGRVVDIKQFTELKTPRTDQQFAAVVAYYYRFEAPADKRKEAIGARDITDAVRLVGKRRQPKDPGKTLNNAKNSGYLDAEGRGKFKINSVGENLVAMTLPGKDQQTPTVKKAGKTKKKKKKKAPAKKHGKASK